LVVHHINYVSALIDVQCVVNSVLFIDGVVNHTPSSTAGFGVSFAIRHGWKFVHYLFVVEGRQVRGRRHSEVFIIVVTNNRLQLVGVNALDLPDYSDLDFLMLILRDDLIRWGMMLFIRHQNM
jgi:hypothetical protein